MKFFLMERCDLGKRPRELEVEEEAPEFLAALDAVVAQAEHERAEKRKKCHVVVVPRQEPFLGVKGLCLLASFISREEERKLLECVDKSVWDTSLKRRTQHYGFVYSYSSKGLAQAAPPIPPWCDFLVARLLEQAVLAVRPDQMIVNEYEPGQGIFPHVDSTASFEDGIVSVSLGSDIVMEFLHERTKEQKAAVLPRCSALSLHGVARYEWRHGIAARKADSGVKRHRRVSLTFRKIKK